MSTSCSLGVDDFGGGSILVLESQCLRCARESTDCTLCADACPVDAIVCSGAARPHINSHCISCNLCVGVCPFSALSGSKKTSQQVNRLALEASLSVEHLVLTCERTEAELSQGVKVPCLGMLTSELWFSLLNEIGAAQMDAVSVFLPHEQCKNCPVNAKENAEEIVLSAISEAESWTGKMVGVITDATALPQKRKPVALSHLAGSPAVDRRDAFTEMLKDLKGSWKESAPANKNELDKEALQKSRKESFQSTLLAEVLRESRSAAKQPIAVAKRFILIEALGRSRVHAAEIALVVSDTEHSKCTLCQKCLSVCPVRARGTMSCGEDTYVNAEPLYCMGCSACIQACPEQACVFTSITGEYFLLNT